MRPNSYLLVLDGSAESRAAAYAAWRLAQGSGAGVAAQCVVDVPAIERLLPCGPAGFIGSGPYMEARERTVDALRSVAETLMLSYRAQAEGRNMGLETYIDEGDPVAEICKRAQEHELLVIGYDMFTVGAKHADLCENLAQKCPCPVVFVNGAGKTTWSQVHVPAANIAAHFPQCLAS